MLEAAQKAGVGEGEGEGVLQDHGVRRLLRRVAELQHRRVLVLDLPTVAIAAPLIAY
jgi:hypothetical protein